MKIKNKKNGKIYDVTKERWEAMTNSGVADQFDLVQDKKIVQAKKNLESETKDDNTGINDGLPVQDTW